MLASILSKSALELADSRGYAISSDPDGIGRLLALLSAAVPKGGRILELGTGYGVGTASLMAGLEPRTDAEIVTVERDGEMVEAVKTLPWPKYVRLIQGDAVELLPQLGLFNLVFADGHGGKWERVDLALDAVLPGGILLIDDMFEQESWESWKPARKEALVEMLRNEQRFVCRELDWSTGVIVLVRKII